MKLLPNLKPSELRQASVEQLEQRLNELRTELTKLRSAAARGTIRKQSGVVRAVRRNIARILTVLNEKGAKSESTA